MVLGAKGKSFSETNSTLSKEKQSKWFEQKINCLRKLSAPSLVTGGLSSEAGQPFDENFVMKKRWGVGAW